MGLRNYVLPTRDIDVGSTIITVRGINVADISLLLKDYGPKLGEVFATVFQKGEKPEADVKTIILESLGEFPDVAAGLIALASDDYSPETVEIARKLPFTKQVELIEAIFLVTFESQGDLEKLVGTLEGLNRSISGGMKLPDSLSGIGVSEGM